MLVLVYTVVAFWAKYGLWLFHDLMKVFLRLTSGASAEPCLVQDRRTAWPLHGPALTQQIWTTHSFSAVYGPSGNGLTGPDQLCYVG